MLEETCRTPNATVCGEAEEEAGRGEALRGERRGESGGTETEAERQNGGIEGWRVVCVYVCVSPCMGMEGSRGGVCLHRSSLIVKRKHILTEEALGEEEEEEEKEEKEGQQIEKEEEEEDKRTKQTCQQILERT